MNVGFSLFYGVIAPLYIVRRQSNKGGNRLIAAMAKNGAILSWLGRYQLGRNAMDAAKHSVSLIDCFPAAPSQLASQQYNCQPALGWDQQ